MNSMNMLGLFQQFMNNPIQYLAGKKLNIPNQFANDPAGAVQYLMNNGIMSQQQYNQLQQIARQMKGKPYGK